MKKVFTILMSLMLIFTMAVSVEAVTPPLDTPASPTIPDIEVDIDIPDEVFDNWFEDHPIEITPTEPPTEEPTESPVEDEIYDSEWRDQLCEFYKFYFKIIKDRFDIFWR